jgi:hypothetical protein
MPTPIQSKRVKKGITLYSILVAGCALGCYFPGQWALSAYRSGQSEGVLDNAVLSFALGCLALVSAVCLMRIIKTASAAKAPIQSPETTRGK